MTLGLDGVTEDKISKFAEQVNSLLNLKPSSRLSRQKQNQGNYRPSSEMKTLFVWGDWVRFMEFRRLVLERNHVPTAIRKGVVGKMDPEFVLHFAKNDGRLHCRRTGKDLPEKDRQFLEVLDQTGAHFKSPALKKIPVFRPCKLGTQGLAEQLALFDQDQFGLLNQQEFSNSSLALEPKLLAKELKKVNHKLTLCLGPAYEGVALSMPFIASRKNMSKKLSTIDRYGWKIIRLKPFLSEVSTLSDEEDDEKEDESQPKLMLYHPSSIYWSRTGYFNNMSNQDWAAFSIDLPKIFLWLLNLVSEIINEKPKDLYVTLSYLESVICLRHKKLLHTLTDAKILKHRLVSAMRKKL